jgi:hypothetical protein
MKPSDGLMLYNCQAGDTKKPNPFREESSLRWT